VRLHQDFLQAGADILLTCTFGASPLRLEASGADVHGTCSAVNATGG